jgi:hypothetical protein
MCCHLGALDRNAIQNMSWTLFSPRQSIQTDINVDKICPSQLIDWQSPWWNRHRKMLDVPKAFQLMSIPG